MTPHSTHRSGKGEVGVNNEVDRLTLSTSARADAIFKSGTKAVTINANGGDDLISARDSIGDTANCGAGNDFVLTDPLDTLADCESSDRVTAPPPRRRWRTGGGTGTTTMDTTMMQSMMTMQAEMQDDTPPTAGVSGVGRTIKLRTLLRGLTRHGRRQRAVLLRGPAARLEQQRAPLADLQRRRWPARTCRSARACAASGSSPASG